MTIPNISTDTFTSIAARSQEATTTAIRRWADSLQHYVVTFSSDHPLPRPDDAQAVVTTWFDLAAALLAEQRKLATALVDTGVRAAGAVADQGFSAARTGI